MKERDINVSDTFAYQVYYSARVIQYTWKQVILRNGLEISLGQWIALNRLYHKEEMFQSDFVNEVFDDRPSVTRMIASMEKKGLIIKQQDTFDKRKYRIRLTPEGVELHHKLSEIIKEDRKRLYRGLNNNDYVTLKQILEKLNKNAFVT
ncbi:MAG: MarR family transcriptional regulator [Deltaproteobacteria bacterium]|nr:MarR family transcriptional regulator [Deltaproteobacteria bacterium]